MLTSHQLSMSRYFDSCVFAFGIDQGLASPGTSTNRLRAGCELATLNSNDIKASVIHCEAAVLLSALFRSPRAGVSEAQSDCSSPLNRPWAFCVAATSKYESPDPRWRLWHSPETSDANVSQALGRVC